MSQKRKKKKKEKKTESINLLFKDIPFLIPMAYLNFSLSYNCKGEGATLYLDRRMPSFLLTIVNKDSEINLNKISIASNLKRKKEYPKRPRNLKEKCRNI
jgi:hypothetical protein